jgi:hypothetical protein
MIRSRLLLGPALAAGLTALALPVVGQPATAAAVDLDFGYSSKLVATPMQVEVFEPTIPLPATPQGEADFGYSRVVADSSSGRSRSSYLWPGAAVGEGAKTIEEAVLGPAMVPAEIANAVYDSGYPIQVNATHPGGPEYEADESFPGMVQRAGATPEKTYAQNGYSSTCDTSGGGGDGGDGGDGGPDLPIDLPFLRASTSSTAASSSAAEEPECPIPAEPSALFGFGGYSSATKNEVLEDGSVKVTTRSAASDITLVAGVVSFSGVKSTIVATSSGKAPEASGKADYGTMTIGGQEFAIGPNGVEGGGQGQEIPGLPDDPNAALAALGITVEVPKPKFTVEGKAFTGVIEGLLITINSKTLTDALRTLPLADLVATIPDTNSELDQIKSALQAAVFLSPKFVFHLGSAQAELTIADPIVIPPLPEVPPTDPEPETPPTTPGGGGTGAVTPPSGVGGTDIPVDTSAPPAAAPTTAEITPASSPGLPPLNTIPGMLMVGSILGAVLAGSYVRRLGAAALGLGGSCADGLDSGLPDLRKA